MDVHEQITVVDGLIAAKWGPEVFRAMRCGSAYRRQRDLYRSAKERARPSTSPCAVVSVVRPPLRPDHADPSHTGHCRRQGQPPHRYHPGLVRTAHQSRIGSTTQPCSSNSGVGIIQLTYNTQNYIGSGCSMNRTIQGCRISAAKWWPR